MGLNWLSMAWLCRSVTGLSWPRFARAHAPAVFLAGLIGGVAAIAAQGTRAAHLGNLPVLIAAGLAAAGAAYGASKLLPQLFLGKHGTWAYQQGEEMVRRGSRRLAGQRVVESDRIASVGEATPK
jgi:hypothetical protein